MLYKHRQSVFDSEIEYARSKFNIISVALTTFSLVFSGFMHVLGDLDFPDFVLIDGWTNAYVLSTRIVWFSTVFMSQLLYAVWNLQEKNVGTQRFPMMIRRRRRINFWIILLKTIAFPTISIPLVVLISDSLGLVFIREVISNFLHQS